MSRLIFFIIGFNFFLSSVTFSQISSAKSQIIESVDAMKSDLIDMADQIWTLAELAFEETGSAEILAAYAERNGMKVERSVAGIPTAFIATYGSGNPVIGIMGEFDALPGISQKAVPFKDPLIDGAPGHGCGHNLFGVGSLAAALAVKEWMKNEGIQGTVRFYGTPAEEKYFGKLYMARAGLFDDLDVCLDWHPSATTEAAVQSSLALIDFIVEFYGQAAHASSDPWNGRSASDAMELYTTGINFMREHVKPSVRMHYHMQDAGAVVNVVPDYSKVWTRVRDNTRTGMMEVYERVKKLAHGASIMTEVDYKISLVSGLHEILVNRTGGAVMQKNLELLGPIVYTEDETTFGMKIQEATGKPQVGMDGEIRPLRPTETVMGGGSTDVGDISWIVPEIRLGVTTAPVGTPWHSWAVVACGGMSIGHKGMIYAAKALAMTMVDLFDDRELREKIREEFEKGRGDYKYKAIIPDGPPPIPAYILDSR
ncbi:MAG TPA: amidohydrolase [Saprospiraceae bacterium]|nr:amidohydrolase [Saprospiraceae bacterium]